MSIDTRALIERTDIVAVASAYTKLKKSGIEYCGPCPIHGGDGDNFYVNPQKRIWACFSRGCHECEEGNDVIGFLRRVEGLDFKAACERLGAVDEWKPAAAPVEHKAKPRAERVTSKPPPTAGRPKMSINALGEPSRVWEYKDGDGGILGYVARYDPPAGKEIRCWTWGSKGSDAPAWGCGHWSKPRPLYGLDRLAARPGAPVMVVEGEKAADAAQELLGQYVVLSWPGGSNAWKHADFEPLRGKRVDLWPDADEPGVKAMQGIADVIADQRGLGCYGKLIDPRGMPEGADAADWPGGDLVGWLKERATWYAEQAPEPPPEPSAESVPDMPPPDDPIPLDAYREDPPAPRKTRKPRLSVVGNAALAPQEDAVPLPQDMSEDALAEHFAQKYGENWRYVKEWGQWFEWDSDRWREDDMSKAERLAIQVTREALYWPEASTLTPKERRQINKKSTAWSVRDIAATHEHIAARIDQWDADPLTLGVPGGVVDLRDARMLPPSREQYISKNCAVAPANGTPERWLEYLKRVHDGNDAIISYLQRYAGYCATGETKEHALAFLYGTGRNGKGVFLETLRGIMGDYARTAPMEVFMEQKHAAHSTELARLHGARLVITEEAASGGRWNEARIKHITGGGQITAHFMRQDDFEFTPQFKLLIAANHKPMLRSVDEAIKARIHLVPFKVTIPPEERDHNLPAKLREEWPQILGWVLDGCAEWQNGGLRPPQDILDATAQYVEAEDVLGQWIDECCERDSAAKMEGAAGYRNYCQWAEKQGERVMSRRSWSNALTEKGYETCKGTGGVRMFAGLELKSSMSVPEFDSRGYPID